MSSDISIRRLKGENRPIHKQGERKELLESIQYVDEVIIFGEDTPQKLKKEISPDILVKGSDWEGNVIGGDYVKGRGGEVILMPLQKDHSSTSIIKKQGLL